MRQSWKIMAVLLSVTFHVSCGGSAAPSASTEKAVGAPQAGSGTKKGDVARVDTKAMENAAWDRIAGHFFKFTTQMNEELHSKNMGWKCRDAFKNNYEEFFPADPVPDLGSTGQVAEAKEQKKSVVMGFLDVLKKAGDLPMDMELAAAAKNDPLTMRTLKEYKFQIIMSGVSNPEVVVVDANQNTHVLHINDRIGNEGGYIQDILKQDVLIKLPETETPVKVSLAPPEIPEQLRVTQ